MSTASQDDSALLPQEIAALLSMKTNSEVECFTAQPQSGMPCAWSARSSPL